MFKTLKVKNCIMALIGSGILAFGLYNIHSLSGVTEGGVLGMTLFLQHWLNISPSITGFIMNAVCYIIGWRSLGKDFVGYSVFAGGGFSAFYALCEQFEPVYPQIAEMPLLASILGAVFVGVGVGICVRAGGAPSGDDALAMSISHISGFKIQWVYLISDLTVLLLSLTYIPISKIMYSLLTVILSGQIIGFIQNFKLKDKINREVEQ